MILLFRCVAEAVFAKGVLGLAEMIPGGGYACAVAQDAWRRYQERKHQQQLPDEIAHIASLTLERAKQEAAAVVQEASARQLAAPSVEEQITLELYLAAIPEAVRQSLKRPEDLRGQSVPAEFTVDNAADLLRLLPARPPRFRAGDALPGKPGWVLDRLLGIGGFGEKAYAQLAASGWLREQHGVRRTIANSYAALDACFTGMALRDLTGRASFYANRLDLSGLLVAIAQGRMVGLNTGAPYSTPGNLVSGHAYVVVGYNPGSGTFTLFNPWGIGNPSGKPGLLALTWGQIASGFTDWDATY